MARGKEDQGAATGQWETIPAHLDKAEETDLRRAKPRLVVRRPGVPEVEIPIEKTEFTIGRHANEVDLVLDDELVSRRHAKLTIDPRGYFRLEDLGSQNGIKFEGRPVRRLNLIDGDKFMIGKSELVFHATMTRVVHSAPQKPAMPTRQDSMIEPPPPEPGGAPPPEDLATDFGEAAEPEEEQ
jgi:pSer/pThr/pTyr-binding forkhead associated (FHA) protein